MAGRPFIRKCLRILNEGGPELEENIMVWIAEGTPIRKLAELAGLGYGHTAALYKWRNEFPERITAWENALKARAEVLADSCLEIADGAPLDPDAIRKADLQIRARTWLAGVSDRERYGKQSETKVQVNIGQLHLTAVKEVNARLQQEAVRRLHAAQTVEAEIEIA